MHPAEKPSRKGKAPNRANDTGASTENSQAEQLTFLDSPLFCPTWPRRGTLGERALGLFLQGRKLDHPGFEEATASWRLAAVVFELRECDWPIESMELPAPTEESPNRFISLYYLPGKYIVQALAISGRKA